MKVYCIGGSRNIGYHASLRLLAKGATVTFLLRSPGVFDGDVTMQTYIHGGTARLVKGDALNKEDVQRGWIEAAKPVRDSEGDSHGVDVLLFTLGASNVKLDICKGVVISPPNLVAIATLNAISTLPTPYPRIVAITSTGISEQSHNELPALLRPLYGHFLRMPLADKRGAETVLARASGATIDKTMAPAEGILPQDWEIGEGSPAPGVLRDNLVIIRPAALTNGPCLSETKGPSVVRTRVERDLPVKGGYTISRQDVAYFIAERVLGDGWDTWKGKGVSLSS